MIAIVPVLPVSVFAEFLCNLFLVFSRKGVGSFYSYKKYLYEDFSFIDSEEQEL
jgi:hypothetical protein